MAGAAIVAVASPAVHAETSAVWLSEASLMAWSDGDVDGYNEDEGDRHQRVLHCDLSQSRHSIVDQVDPEAQH